MAIFIFENNLLFFVFVCFSPTNFQRLMIRRESCNLGHCCLGVTQLIHQSIVPLNIWISSLYLLLMKVTPTTLALSVMTLFGLGIDSDKTSHQAFISSQISTKRSCTIGKHFKSHISTYNPFKEGTIEW